MGLKYRWIRDNQTTKRREFSFEEFGTGGYSAPAENYRDWGKYPDAPEPPEQLEEIMGAVAAKEYRELAAGGQLYGRKVPEMSPDELVLTIGFLLKSAQRPLRFPR